MKYSLSLEVGFSIYGIYFFYTVRCGKLLFMTFGDYRNIDSIGWICYIDDMNNVKNGYKIARFALSINFFSWIGLIVYITTMVSAIHQRNNKSFCRILDKSNQIIFK